MSILAHLADTFTTLAGAVGLSRWASGRRYRQRMSSAARYDLYEDVIVKLRFDGALTKAQQHEQCQRIWDAAGGA